MQGNKMFSKEDFVKWIKASHDLFEIFEGRHDAYPLAIRWVEEWFKNGKFNVKDCDKQRIRDLINNFNFEVFDIEDSIIDEIESELKSLSEEISKRQSNVGFAISLYLFTWNFQRFKKYYFKKNNKNNNNFLLLNYFENVGNELEKLKNDFKYFRKKDLIKDNIEEDKIKDIYDQVHEILSSFGIGENEPIGTIKVLHIFSSHYFPLLDNPIAEQMGLKKHDNDKIDNEKYITWMKVLKNWLENYKDEIPDLENKYGYSILKLVDEGFYIMCSMNLRNRINRLGIKNKI